MACWTLAIIALRTVLAMFLRSTPRKKNGKVHKYWSLV
jgi:hypothetical protein